MVTLRERGRTMRNRSVPLAAGVTLEATRRPTRENNYTAGTATITGASVGRTVYAVNTVGGPRISFGERDYLIPAASYTLGTGGTVTEPKEGDRFVETINGTDYCFECKPNSGEPAWRYSDSGRTLLRVHVRRITDYVGRNLSEA